MPDYSFIHMLFLKPSQRNECFLLCFSIAAISTFTASCYHYPTRTPTELFIDCVASLRKIDDAKVKEGQVVRVLGFYRAGDGGGGLFCFHPGRNDGAITEIAVASLSGNGRWVRVVNGPLNVRWLGAVGNGIAADDIPINAAIQYLRGAGGGTLYLPAGVYLITRHVFVDFSNFRLMGDGIGNTVIKVGSWVDGIRVSNASYPQTSSTISNITIENLSIDGNYLGYANAPNDTYGNGINLNSVEKFFIRNVHVYDTKHQGIVSTFFGPSGRETQAHGLITNCIVEMRSLKTIGIGIEGHFAHVIVSDNRVSLSQGGTGIYFGNAGEVNNDNGECTCTGNVVTANATDIGVGIRAEQCWHAITITSNAIKGFAIGIRVDNGQGSNASGACVNGNHIRDFGAYGIVTSPTYGVERASTIVGNTITTRLPGKAGALIGMGTLFANNMVHAGDGSTMGVIAESGCCIANNMLQTGSYSVDLSVASDSSTAVLGNYMSNPIRGPEKGRVGANIFMRSSPSLH